MPKMTIRPLVAQDRRRVCEISAQIWDGEGYVPEAFDSWIQDQEGEAVGAILGNVLIAFAHRTWLHPGVAWFEGIRTDPAFRGQGAGKAITGHFVDGARRDSAERICLSTYVDNEASIHIIEGYGFERVASFAYLEKNLEKQACAHPAEPGVVDVSEREAIEFIDRSEFLRLARRRFPRGWRFFPFDVDPQAAIARMEARLGVRRGGQLTALLCIRQSEGGSGPFTLNFLDVAPEDMRSLLRNVHQRYAGRRVETMIPKHGEQEAAVLSLLKDFGYTSWEDYAAAVFVYERTP